MKRPTVEGVVQRRSEEDQAMADGSNAEDIEELLAQYCEAAKRQRKDEVGLTQCHRFGGQTAGASQPLDLSGGQAGLGRLTLHGDISGRLAGAVQTR